MKRNQFRRLLQKEMVKFSPPSRLHGGITPKDYADAGSTLILYVIGKEPENTFQGFDALKVSKPFTIASDPAQWKDVSYLNGGKLSQNIKDPTCFSKDDGSSWYNVDADHAKQALKNTALSLNRFNPVVGENVDDTDDEKDKETPEEKPEPEEPVEPEQPEKAPEEPVEPEQPEQPEKPEAEPEEPVEPEQPEETPPEGEEVPPEEKQLTKEDAKLIVKLLLRFKGHKIPQQATQKLAKSLGVTKDSVEDFIYNLASKYVQLHMVGRQQKEPEVQENVRQGVSKWLGSR